jgi:hypothetical protein
MNDFASSSTWKLGVQIRQSFDGSFGRILVRYCIGEPLTKDHLLLQSFAFSGAGFPKYYLLNSFRLRETLQSRTRLRLFQGSFDLPVVDFSMVLAASPFRFKCHRIIFSSLPFNFIKHLHPRRMMGLGKVRLSSSEIGAQGLACESRSLVDVYFFR